MSDRSIMLAYDITDRRRRDRVFRYLSGIRVDGQKSVHELSLSAHDIPDVIAGVLEYVDPSDDKVLLCAQQRHRWLPRVLQICGTPAESVLASSPRPDAGFRWHDHDYLLAYDIRGPKRLRRLQKLTGGEGLFLQRSVYLLNLSLARYETFKEAVLARVDPDVDDVRLYPLVSLGDVYYLCGGNRGIYGLNNTPEDTMDDWLARGGRQDG